MSHKCECGGKLSYKIASAIFYYECNKCGQNYAQERVGINDWPTGVFYTVPKQVPKILVEEKILIKSVWKDISWVKEMRYAYDEDEYWLEEIAEESISLLEKKLDEVIVFPGFTGPNSESKYGILIKPLGAELLDFLIAIEKCEEAISLIEELSRHCGGGEDYCRLEKLKSRLEKRRRKKGDVKI